MQEILLHLDSPSVILMHARDYQPGERVPGTVYRVVRRIGAGGMGTVYDVEDTTIGKRYVLKTLHPQLGSRDDLARRMQNEARTLARLNHPNIVEVFTAGVTTDALRLPFYVMERLSGQSLRLVLEKRGQLELHHAFHIAIDLLDALDHAHDKGVIHRDVKPDNIFLHRTQAGITVTKLLDFGIVSLLDSGSAETAGRFLGTLRYAAPEQLRGEKPSAKTDIYAAGLVLYEILAGRGPFDNEGDPHRLGAAHLHKAPPPVSQFAQVPRDLEVLLTAALSKNPVMRPRDAFSFAASLRNLKRNSSAAPMREPMAPPSSSGVARPQPPVNTRPLDARPDASGVRSGAVPARLPTTTVPGLLPPTGPAAPGRVGSSPFLEAHAPLGSLPHSFGEGVGARSVHAGMDPQWAGERGLETATTAEAVDRDSPTSTGSASSHRHTSASETEMMSASVEGVAFPVDRTHPAVPSQEVREALAWPPHRPSAFSDAPQVRSILAPAPPRWRGATTVAAFAAAAMVTVFVGVRASRTASSSHLAAEPSPTASGELPGITATPTAIPPPVLPSARPTDAIPAPTLVVPSLEDPALPTASASAHGRVPPVSSMARAQTASASSGVARAPGAPSGATRTPATPASSVAVHAAAKIGPLPSARKSLGAGPFAPASASGSALPRPGPGF